mmetsp:Transcript_29412/g.57591  ORF Transcript_29412/g.57591 Transcript_29412/m.57591 type:complete len:503 (+) Transcript_29412:526-2034(+)
MCQGSSLVPGISRHHVPPSKEREKEKGIAERGRQRHDRERGTGARSRERDRHVVLRKGPLREIHHPSLLLVLLRELHKRPFELLTAAIAGESVALQLHHGTLRTQRLVPARHHAVFPLVVHAHYALGCIVLARAGGGEHVAELHQQDGVLVVIVDGSGRAHCSLAVDVLVDGGESRSHLVSKLLLLRCELFLRRLLRVSLRRLSKCEVVRRRLLNRKVVLYRLLKCKVAVLLLLNREVVRRGLLKRKVVLLLPHHIKLALLLHDQVSVLLLALQALPLIVAGPFLLDLPQQALLALLFILAGPVLFIRSKGRHMLRFFLALDLLLLFPLALLLLGRLLFPFLFFFLLSNQSSSRFSSSPLFLSSCCFGFGLCPFGFGSVAGCFRLALPGNFRRVGGCFRLRLAGSSNVCLVRGCCRLAGPGNFRAGRGLSLLPCRRVPCLFFALIRLLRAPHPIGGRACRRSGRRLRGGGCVCPGRPFGRAAAAAFRVRGAVRLTTRAIAAY